jgi:hypothetical protein
VGGKVRRSHEGTPREKNCIKEKINQAKRCLMKVIKFETKVEQRTLMN